MKKILLVSLVMLLAVSAAFSQFGIKGGIDLGTFGGADKPSDLKYRMGIAGGISCKIGLVAGLSLQPEVMYIQKGAVMEVNTLQGIYTINDKQTAMLDYIDIPVLIKFNFPIPVFSPYIEGGVSYGILISAKSKLEESSNQPGTTSSSNETDIKDFLTKNDLSIVVGVGFDLSILEIDARYLIGTKKVYKDDPTLSPNPGDAKIFNNGIILTAGLRF
jgi:Outer membrane protein beta-barrel domain